MFHLPSMNHIGFRVTKKILIGISLMISFVLTMALSTILTPPYPRLSIILDSLNRLRNIKLRVELPNIFTLPKIAAYPTPGTNNQPIFSKNTPGPNQTNFPSQTIPTNGLYPTGPGGPTYQPTNIPSIAQPSSTPKPTKPPKPTPTEPIKLETVRPGKNFQEVANILQPIICIPQAMIMATLQKEWGPWMAKTQANWTSANTYPGFDPAENAPAQSIGGVMQMMADTWRKIKPYVSQKLGNAPLALSVTFDAMAGGAYHLHNVSLAMQDKISCDDWPVKYILYGACRYNGGCAPGSYNYNQYAYDVCNLYNQYTKGLKKNCH